MRQAPPCLVTTFRSRVSHGVFPCELTGLCSKDGSAQSVSFVGLFSFITRSDSDLSCGQQQQPRSVTTTRTTQRPPLLCPYRRHDIGVIASASATVIDAAEPTTPFFGDYSGMITSREKAAKKKRQVTVKLGGA